MDSPSSEKEKEELPTAPALLQSYNPELRNKRKPRRNDLVPIPHKWFEVLAMHLAGKPTREIVEETGYTSASVYRIMNSPRTQAVRQQLLSSYQDEYEALFGKIINNIRVQLDSDDIKVQQTAQQQWLNSEKKFRSLKLAQVPGESAEDVVARMLNVNVQVNVANDRQEAE